MTELPEQKEHLWVLAASPTIWAVHFLLCYLTAAVWCAKIAGIGGPLETVRATIAVYTILALAGIGYILHRGYKRHTLGSATVRHDFDTREDRHRFLGFATVLLSGLSAVAVVYVAIVALFIKTCN